MIQDVSLLAAFVAGVLSITSPCVLPLIPIYLAHLAGVSIGEGGVATRARVMLNAVAFVLGFSGVFVLLGVSFGALGELLANERVWLVRLGGVLLVAMGLHLIGVVRLPFLEREHRWTVVPAAGPLGRVASSLAVGAAFGAGWTPCVG
ncbi:MAG: cytochrome c biogenesis protein CcdA, partial [Chloroflexota bacterium]|nr:cytochrome c biogenesis protein CcdA [Chloroflexota bacterium]